MVQWIQAHGGLLAVVLVGVTLFNILMSAVAQVCAALSVQEPGVLQTMGSVGLKISQWLSANTPTPSAPAVSSSVPESKSGE